MFRVVAFSLSCDICAVFLRSSGECCLGICTRICLYVFRIGCGVWHLSLSFGAVRWQFIVFFVNVVSSLVWEWNQHCYSIEGRCVVCMRSFLCISAWCARFYICRCRSMLCGDCSICLWISWGSPVSMERNQQCCCIVLCLCVWYVFVCFCSCELVIQPLGTQGSCGNISENIKFCTARRNGTGDDRSNGQPPAPEGILYRRVLLPDHSGKFSVFCAVGVCVFLMYISMHLRLC